MSQSEPLDPMSVDDDADLQQSRHTGRLILLWIVLALFIVAGSAMFIYSRAWSDADEFFSKEVNGIEHQTALHRVTFSAEDLVRFEFRLTHVGDVKVVDDAGEPLASAWLLLMVVETEATWTLSEFGILPE